MSKMYMKNQNCVYYLVWRECTVAARATKICKTKHGLELKTSEMPGRILSNSLV